MEFAAIIKDNVVINNIVINARDLWAYKNSPDFEGDDVIACSRDVLPGDTFDTETGIFFRDGVRIYPEETDIEKSLRRITELETQVEDTQAALIELAAIIGGAD